MTITSGFAKWLLYKLILLKDMVDMLEPRSTAAAQEVIREKYFTGSSSIEKIAVKKAAVSRVICLVERAIANMSPEQRQVYRLRFRSRYSYKDIMQRAAVSESTLTRRLEEIVDLVIVYVGMADEDDMKEFNRFFED
jgi:DNA-directed RNA polymerase specialized sigma24 family protein